MPARSVMPHMHPLLEREKLYCRMSAEGIETSFDSRDAKRQKVVERLHDVRSSNNNKKTELVTTLKRARDCKNLIDRCSTE